MFQGWTTQLWIKVRQSSNLPANVYEDSLTQREICFDFGTPLVLHMTVVQDQSQNRIPIFCSFFSNPTRRNPPGKHKALLRENPTKFQKQYILFIFDGKQRKTNCFEYRGWMVLFLTLFFIARLMKNLVFYVLNYQLICPQNNNFVI